MNINSLINDRLEVEKQIIVHGHCEDVLKTFQDKSIDLFITSPPYNIGIKYNDYKDSRKDYLEWLYEIFLEVKRILKDDGSLFLNTGSISSNPWISFDIIQKLRSLFVLQNHIIWCKSISISKTKNFGQYKPINSNRYLNHTFENIFHLTKDGINIIDRLSIGVPFVDKINLNTKTGNINGDLRCIGNVWFIPYETIQTKKDRGTHPAIFPKKLVENCLKLHGYNENTIVCDPFSGSGTTLVVCKELMVKGIGIEQDIKYVSHTKTRLNNSFIKF